MSQRTYLRGHCQQCEGHLEFPADALGDEINCPHCLQKTNLLAVRPAQNRSRQGLIWGLILLTLLLFVGGLAGYRWHLKKVTAHPPLAKKTVPLPPVPMAEVTNHNFAISGIRLDHPPDSSLVYVIGQLRNLEVHQRFGVKVSFKLYGLGDRYLGQATDYHSVLDPQGTWKFKALVLESKVVSASLDSVLEDQ